MALIDIDGVTKTYVLENNRELTAVDRVQLSIGDGEFVSIIGPSGCGKSTLLHMIGGFVPCSSGEIRVRGEWCAHRGPTAASYSSISHYSPGRRCSAMSNMAWPSAASARPNAGAPRKPSSTWSNSSGFENTYPSRLSGGMQQRVAIARMLACEPSILLMDEPFGALDAQTRKIMQEELRELWQRFRKTVVFVTHDVREAVFLSQRVVVMSARPGRIKTIVETGLGPDASRAAIDEKADELWDMLRDEVVRTIAAEGREPMTQVAAGRDLLSADLCRARAMGDRRPRRPARPLDISLARRRACGLRAADRARPSHRERRHLAVPPVERIFPRRRSSASSPAC